MVSLNPPVCDFNSPALPFDLQGTDGQCHTLDHVRGPNGLLVAFICNHCPYVKAIAESFNDDAKALQDMGIGVIAIMSNDSEAYPEDNFDNMKIFAKTHGFSFPYVIDRDQSVAQAYGAVCTPDFFGYNKDLLLQYRGRLDDSGRQQSEKTPKRELREAMDQVASTGKGPLDQTASIGCSIKWRDEAI